MSSSMHEPDTDFIKQVLDYYSLSARNNLPWRKLSNALEQRFYQVLVSELMLQQTQVSRVIPKYNAWMSRFPSLADASEASLIEILSLWQGLGYNRRGRYLHQAIIVVRQSGISNDIKMLQALPGVGKNTAGAILAYVFNEPALFVETNIRTVYIHHYFPNMKQISDQQIIEILERTLDKTSPRQWYWALMDYGTFLKQRGNNIAMSKHYVKQTAFEGSQRQLRAGILRTLLDGPKSYSELESKFHDERLSQCLLSLQKDKLIQKDAENYGISN